MSNLNTHQEQEYQDIDYICLKIGKAHKTQTLEQIALENKRPVKWVKEMLERYDKLY
jgi:hypothetical protein